MSKGVASLGTGAQALDRAGLEPSRPGFRMTYVCWDAGRPLGRDQVRGRGNIGVSPATRARLRSVRG
jgi:hypothetical protein